MIPALVSPTQSGFVRALLDPTLPAPPGLATWNGSDPALRFAVYRNNVVVSLVAALADTFPVVRELVGADFFTAMARLYVAEQPPSSPVLAHYGDGFADWVGQFEPAAAVPYLADIARLERARVRAYHAADAPLLGADTIAAQLADPERLPAARLQLHPSVTVLASPWAVVSLWAAHQGQGRLGDVDPARPEWSINNGFGFLWNPQWAELKKARVWLAAAGLEAWSYDASGIAWVSGTQYQAVARSVDTALNYSLPYATATFTFDTSVPTLFVSTPAADSTLETPSLIAGTAADSAPNAGVANWSIASLASPAARRAKPKRRRSRTPPRVWRRR